MPEAFDLDPNPFVDTPCVKCGARKLRVEMRPYLVARPLGTFSLAGAQDKVSAHQGFWPWAVCDGCGGESKGKP